MLILLPPSEGKSVPTRGKPLDLSGLSLPGLTPAREAVLDALVDLCTGDPEAAAGTLGLGGTQVDLVALNARLRTAPTARAGPDLLRRALRRPRRRDALRRGQAPGGLPARGHLVAVRAGPPGRPDPGVPALGRHHPARPRARLPAVWRRPWARRSGVPAAARLLVDLRSSTYAAFWRPPADLAPRVATVRVLHEVNGKRQVVSHFNKATKGRIVRAVLEDGGSPRTPGELADLLAGLGWKVEVGDAARKGTQLDVVVSEV